MSSPLRVVTVNGSYSAPSKTGALLELVTTTLADHFDLDVTRVEVSALGPGFTSALERTALSPEGLAAVEAVEQADLVVAGTPVFRGSYTGLFKHFFDMVDQYALANHPALLVATGGGERHALVLEHQLRPLFGFFQAATAPVGIYASTGDFDGTTILNPKIYSRIDTALGDLKPRLQAAIAADTDAHAVAATAA